jgi:hypothetical protein
MIAVLSATIQCRSWLSSPSLDIAAVCRPGHLFACCFVASVEGLGTSCLCCIPGRSKVSFRTSYFGILGVASSLIRSLRLCHAQWVIFLPAAVNSFRGPQFLWVRMFRKMFPSRHATAARRDTFLQAANNFLRNPHSPRASSFFSPRRSAAKCRPLFCFFVVPQDFTAAFSVGTSSCSTSDSMSSEFSPLLSRHASIVISQDIVSFLSSSCLLFRHLLWVSFPLVQI